MNNLFNLIVMSPIFPILILNLSKLVKNYFYVEKSNSVSQIIVKFYFIFEFRHNYFYNEVRNLGVNVGENKG
jgi:hypothetical protein